MSSRPKFFVAREQIIDNKVTLIGSDVSHIRTVLRLKAGDSIQVISDSDTVRGVLTTDTYICPKCDGREAYAELRQTRASDEPETRILKCKDCSHGWREY